MKKALYSVALSDDVVRELDVRARQRGINRSDLIDQILAEYVSVPTPEQKINDIFKAIEELTAPVPDLAAFFAPNALTISLKSSLEFKYRPTVKYEVRLYRGGNEALGEIAVIFRTQSRALIGAMTAFFRLLKCIEDRCLAPRLDAPVSYALYEGRFVRSVAVPSGRDCTAGDIAGAISDYIQLFDSLMKGCLDGHITDPDAESRYRMWLDGREILI